MPSESSRFAVEFFRFNEIEMASVGGMLADPAAILTSKLFSSDVLAILLEFFAAQDVQGPAEYLAPIAEVR